MTIQMYICLAIFVLMILGFVFADKLHTTLGVVGLCAIMLVTYTGLVPTKTVLGYFAHQNVLLITGMFIVAAGFRRTQAVHKVASLITKISGGNFTIVLAGYLAVAFLLTQMMGSPMVVFGVVSPLLAASCEEFNISPSKAMFPLGIVGVGCVGCLPFGSGATRYATENTYLESFGYTDFQMELLDPFKGRFLVALLLYLFAVLVIPKLCPEQPSVPITTKVASKSNGNSPAPLDPVREVLGYGIFLLTTLALIFQSKLGFDNWQISMTGAALVAVTGVLTPKEAINAIPVRIILMLVSALVVGGAMMECGLGDLIGDTMANVMSGMHSNYAIGAAFFIVPFLLTQGMQNQSVQQIFRPIVILTCKSLGCNPVGPLLLLSAATSAAFMTPMATGTIAPMMEAGGYTQRDLLKIGFPVSIFICVTSIFIIMTVFPLY